MLLNALQTTLLSKLSHDFYEIFTTKHQMLECVQSIRKNVNFNSE